PPGTATTSTLTAAPRTRTTACPTRSTGRPRTAASPHPTGPRPATEPAPGWTATERSNASPPTACPGGRVGWPHACRRDPEPVGGDLRRGLRGVRRGADDRARDGLDPELALDHVGRGRGRRRACRVHRGGRLRARHLAARDAAPAGDRQPAAGL